MHLGLRKPVIFLSVLIFLMGWLHVGFCRSFKADITRQIQDLRDDITKIEDALKNLRRRSCPAAYVRFKRSCFRFIMDEKHKAVWAEAEQFCLSEGGHLVSVDSKRKYKFIKKYLLKNFKAYFNSGEPALLYTGLIYTNQNAKLPFDPFGPSHSMGKEANGFRWTGTGLRPGAESNAKWKPNYSSTNRSPDAWLSCVVIEFNPKSSAGVLLWRGHTCSSKKNSFICEVRLPRSGENQGCLEWK
ncbi:hypothetical protein RRG08_056789 [Elysia crispata]|uniref:C-type lectin domain-containing protein n=1 Tax=Elysia crispata TaxID=231223 RepID=A0AAE1DWD8_9GAST|nr:hypothetical protein RRG08_056789 [Elysia crispata]